MGGVGVIAEPFGLLPDGRAVERFTLANDRGLSAAVITYGGILQRLEAPDREGRAANVTLGYDAFDRYVDATYMRVMPFFGAIIGRFGNRIAGGTFTLDGETYELPLNNGPNS